jgi:hydrogenase nickel incorporation protein HypB
LKDEKTFLVNLMSSPGSGKTTTLLALAKALEGKMSWGVMEADIDSAVDAETMQNAGIKSIQIHTGGMCHLDADMSRQSLKEIGSENLDVVILENVGNLVCPAEFDTGAVKDLVILSIPEGDDKPLKYPLMFEKADAVLVNKIDALEVFDFDMTRFTEFVRMRNSSADIFPVSAETGEGFDAAADWIRAAAREWLGR